MLGTKIQINIERYTDTIDTTTGEYTKQSIYSNINARMIEIRNKTFSTETSQADTVQMYTFYLCKDKTNVKVGDNISYTDPFGPVKMKITTRPKMIEFQESENFIKLTAELIGE